MQMSPIKKINKSMFKKELLHSQTKIIVYSQEKNYMLFFFLIYKSNTKGSSYTGGQGSQSGNCVSYL